MKIIIAREINGVHYTFQVEEDKDIDALFNASLYAAMPTKCELCGSEHVHLSGNKAQGYQFVKMICEDCNARAQLGQYKDGGMFWKTWEKYEAPSTTTTSAPVSKKVAVAPKEEVSSVEDVEDVDFKTDLPF